MNELKKLYFSLIIPAVVLTAGVFFMLEYKLWNGFNFQPDKTFSILIFVLAIAFGVALPILLRVYYYSKLKEKKFYSAKDFYDYERIIILVISVTPYLALIAALLKLPDFYFGGTALAAIYAMYYHFPSEKKIILDKKIFRVKDERTERPEN